MRHRRSGDDLLSTLVKNLFSIYRKEGLVNDSDRRGCRRFLFGLHLQQAKPNWPTSTNTKNLIIMLIHELHASE